MDDNLKAQIAAYAAQVDGLTRRGGQLRDRLARDSSDASAIADTRIWQEQCGILINQLSGGSKAHWLARLFSEAFLMRSTGGQALEGAPPKEIVQRLLGVLEQAAASLSRKDDGPVLSTASDNEPRRFDFVHNADLRPIVEKAYADSRRALEQGDYSEALRTSCGILEAIVTDALESKGVAALGEPGALAGGIADWPFETRLSVAEKAGLIRGGWVRLPFTARSYRDHVEGETEPAIAEADARRAVQVLNVIMRDLNPGR